MPQQLEYEHLRDQPPPFGGRVGAISLIISAAWIMFLITLTATTSTNMGRDIPPIFEGPLRVPLLFAPPLIGLAIGVGGLWADQVKKWAFAGAVLNALFYVLFCFPGIFWFFWIMSDFHVAG